MKIGTNHSNDYEKMNIVAIINIELKIEDSVIKYNFYDSLVLLLSR